MKTLRTLLLPIVVACFFPVVPFSVPYAVLTSCRWIAAAILAIAVATSQSHRSRLPGTVVGCFFVFSLYALMTSFWSQNPRMTLYKGGAFLLAAGALFFGGYHLSAHYSRRNPFDCLRFVFLNAVFLTAVSLVVNPGRAIQGGFLYGYTGNPNYLGLMTICAMPWALTRLGAERHRYVNACLVAAGCLIVFGSRSRSAILAGAVLFSFALAPYFRRHVGIMLLAVMAAGAAVVVSTDKGIEARDAIVYKDATGSTEDAFRSRRDNWAAAWEAAKSGGIFGVGYGIADGLSGDWSGQFTSFGFGREKSFSQLAVVEEVGLVGFVLYAAMLVSLYLAMRKSYYTGPHTSHRKIVYRLAVGFLLAMTVHSAVEGWFTSPGSPESAAFWATMGASLGWLTLNSRRTRCVQHANYSITETCNRPGLLGRAPSSSVVG